MLHLYRQAAIHFHFIKMDTLQLWQHEKTTWNSALFLPQMSFSCITTEHSQKALLNKSCMSVEIFPGRTATTTILEPVLTVLRAAYWKTKMSSFTSSDSLLVSRCQRGGFLSAPQRKGKIFPYPLDWHQKAYKVQAGWRQRWTIIAAESRETRWRPRP